jgi:PAS domain-containing protein
MASSGHGSDRPEQAPDFRLVLDSTSVLIHSARPDGYVDFLNQGWLDYLGLPLEDVRGWGWTNAFHPDDVEACVGQVAGCAR